MNRNQKLTLVLTAVLTLGVGDAAAQDEERRRGPRGVIDVEGIMSMRERLELDDAQMDELEAWRVERLARVSEERARMDEMRSRLRAGQIERSEMMTHMQERRDALFRSRSDSRSRLEGILNERQLQTFDGVAVRARDAVAVRACAVVVLTCVVVVRACAVVVRACAVVVPACEAVVPACEAIVPA